MMQAVDALDHILLIGADTQTIRDEDPTQDEHALLHFDLSLGLADELISHCPNPARFQRAAKCPYQSTARRRDDVIQRRRMRLGDVALDSVVASYRTMHAEENRRGLSRKPGPPERSISALHADV